MMNNWGFIAICMLILKVTGCASKQEEPDMEPQQVCPVSDTIVKVRDARKPRIIDSLNMREIFEDSTRIGIPGRNKISAFVYDYMERWTWIGINFYSKSSSGWELRNNYRFDIGLARTMLPVLDDFNGDGRLDFHCWDFEAARGGNNVRRLFMYDRRGDSLVHIVNSHEYPNMVYNKILRCVEGQAITGTSYQLFARIQYDSLVEFAKIDRLEMRKGMLDTYTRLKKQNGGYRIVDIDSIIGYNPYDRFQNYLPLVKYEVNPADYKYERTRLHEVGGKSLPLYKWRRRLEL